MQPLIKYYNLESRSWNEVSELEDNLNRHLWNLHKASCFVDDDVAKPILATLAKKAGAGGLQKGVVTDLGTVSYDDRTCAYVEALDGLYKRVWEISPRKFRLFRKSIPERVGIDLVVKVYQHNYIIKLQEYFSQSGIKVVEGRSASKATFDFCTFSNSDPKYDKSMIENLIKENMRSGSDISLLGNVKCDEINFGTVSAIVRGDVIEVLRFRNKLKKRALAWKTSIFRESVMFS